VQIVKWVAGFLVVDVAIGVAFVYLTKAIKKRRKRTEPPRY